MSFRPLIVLLVLLAALAAVVPASAWATGGGGSGSMVLDEPEDPEPIPDFWTEEEPAKGSGSGGSGSGSGSGSQQQQTSGGDAPRTSDQTSTSPGGTAPGSGTVTTGPGAQASTPEATPAQARPACDPPAMLRLTLRSLRRAVMGRNLLDERALPVPVRIAPCRAGLYELAIVVEGTDTVLWRARRELGNGIKRATLRLAMTNAGRRFVARTRRSGGGVVRMRLRARLYPAL